MMTCGKCHDTEGPFICDVKTGKCRCESCYMLDNAVSDIVKLIKYKAGTKANINMTAVVTMDSIETLVFDELGLN